DEPRRHRRGPSEYRGDRGAARLAGSRRAPGGLGGAVRGPPGHYAARGDTPMSGSVTLFRIRGIPVRAHPSWLLIVALLTWNLAVGYFPQVLPDLPERALWLRGLIAALLLFASVLLHELAHCIAA